MDKVCQRNINSVLNGCYQLYKPKYCPRAQPSPRIHKQHASTPPSFSRQEKAAPRASDSCPACARAEDHHRGDTWLCSLSFKQSFIFLGLSRNRKYHAHLGGIQDSMFLKPTAAFTRHLGAMVYFMAFAFGNSSLS